MTPRLPALLTLLAVLAAPPAIARTPHFDRPWSERVAAAQEAYARDPSAFVHLIQTPPPDAPPTPVVSPNERGHAEGLLLSWDCESAASQPDRWDQMWLDIIDAAWDGVHLYLYIHNGGYSDASDVARCQEMLEQNTSRDPQDATWFSETQDHRLDSIWIRDYGPFFVLDTHDEFGVVDADYVRYSRDNDDAQPAHFASWWGVPRHRWDFATEGGNFLPNGNGLCLVSDTIEGLNPQYTTADMEQLYHDYLGCTELVILPALDDVTGHVDMWITWLDATTLVVGEYSASQDAQGRQVIETAVQEQLSGLADPGSGETVEIVRIPMPDNDGRSVWRNYTNGIWIDDTFLMPVYDGFSTEQAAAVAAFETHGAGVIPIPADVVITSAGALHCISRTIVRPPGSTIPGDDDDDDTGGDDDDDDDPMVEPDDDASDEIRATGGCECRAGHRHPATGAAVSILALGLLVRRRSR